MGNNLVMGGGGVFSNPAKNTIHPKRKKKPSLEYPELQCSPVLHQKKVPDNYA
jgi:hypothetical protein